MMRSIMHSFKACLIAGAALTLVACGNSDEQLAEQHGAVIERYCIDCHSVAEAEADLVLEGVALAQLADDVEIWERVVHKLDVGIMPPPGEARPDLSTTRSLVAYLESQLEATAERAPVPGRQPLHRLNRAEYGNAVHDLLGLRLDVEALLPADSSSHGFDNVSDALKTSPLLLERYLSVGLQIAETAVGDVDIAPRTTSYQPEPDLSQNRWIEGLPLGTRGGLVVDHYFPVDADYEFAPELWEAAASTVRGLEGFQTPFEFQMLLDGEVAHSALIGGLEDDALSNQNQGSATAAARERLRVTLPVTAGLHQLGFTFAMKSFAVEQRVLQPFKSDVPLGNDAYGWPRIASARIVGPFNVAGPGNADVRQGIFTCRPDAAIGHVDCAEQILGRLARYAYSRPLTEADVSTLLDFYDQGSDGGADFEGGIQLALARILSGPEFLFRAAAQPVSSDGQLQRIDDLTLASKLALFLWSSIPDELLLEDAIANRLGDPAVLESHVRRMLSDSRAQALVTNFAEQWLQLRSIANKTPDLLEFPDWDANLRNDMLRETDLFVSSVLLGDRSVLELIGADYSYLNGRLADHYGIDGVHGDAFRRVTIDDPNRRGLLGHGSVLFETSVPTRTSPVFRGKWIMSNIFNAPPSPPPPNVPSLDESAPGSEPRSVRERFERHSTDPVCAGCHRVMDPPGYALENFDAIGRWRDTDNGRSIDAQARLADGTSVNGAAELREAILNRPDVFVRTFTQKLMTYALARGVEAQDMPAIRAIVRDAAQDEYRFSDIVIGIVNSVPFSQQG